MVLCYFQSHSILRLHFQQRPNKIVEFITEIFRTVIINLLNLTYQISPIKVISKRGNSSCKLVSQHSQTPEIQPVIILLLQGNFGADIIRSATVSSSPFSWVWDMHWPSKVSDLNFIVDRKKDVFRFNIAMEDFVLVNMFERLDHLVDIMCCPLLWESSFILQQFIQLSIRRVVEDNINPLIVVEKSVHGEDIRVFEMAVDLYLSSELEDNITIDNLLLGDDLDSHHSFSLSLSRQVHMSIPIFNKIITSPYQDACQSGNLECSSHRDERSCPEVQWRDALECSRKCPYPSCACLSCWFISVRFMCFSNNSSIYSRDYVISGLTFSSFWLGLVGWWLGTGMSQIFIKCILSIANLNWPFELYLIN